MTNETKTTRDWGLIAMLAFSAVAVVLAFLAPRWIDGGERDDDAYQANREKIAAMTAAERDRLKRRAERFYDEKTPEEREAIRNLHADLQNDPEAKELRAVMKRFNDWLTSMSPVAREKFRKAFQEKKTVEEKLAFIEETKQDEDDRRFVSTLDSRSRRMVMGEKDLKKRKTLIANLRESSRSGSRSRRRRFNPLSTSELDAVIAFIETQTPLDPIERERLESMPPNRRRLQAMVLAMQKNGEQRRERKDGFLTDIEFKKAIYTSELDPALIERLVKAADNPWNRRYGALGLVTGSLYHERRELRGNPTESQLNAFLSAMDKEDREKLLKYRGSEKRYRLRRAYFYGGEDGREFRDYSYAVFRTMSRRYSRGPRSRSKPPPRKPNSNGKRGR